MKAASVADAARTHVAAAVAGVTLVADAGAKRRACAFSRTGQTEIKAACECEGVVPATSQEVDVGAAQQGDESGNKALREIVSA